MKKLNNIAEEYKILLREIPSLIVAIFVLSVVAMNILANKELFSTTYLALDCGFSLSWISFICMDIICKHYGPKAATKISILALIINLITCGIFYLMSLTPGMWGEFYTYNIPEVNNALNSTIGGTWYVVLGSALAMLVSSLVNAFINWSIGKSLKSDGFKAFAIRSFISTGIAQFVDNLIFATVVSKVFFGWTWLQVFTCSITAAIFELLCEVIFSPIGYKVSKNWQRDNVGENYIKKYPVEK